MKPKISVIVPVYKVQPYLSKCLESISHQTYDNLEIILIDDGSPDKCPSICDEFAIKDKRTKVIHKENGGLSSARNAGLEIATGDYITFVDSDDWLELDMYSVLVNNLEKENADVSVCANIEEYETDSINLNNNSNCTKVFTDLNEIYKHLLPTCRPTLLFMVWNKLFKREVVGDIRFKVGQIYEDMYFDRELFKKCKKVVYSTYRGYHYRIGRNGSTATFFKEIKLNKFNEINSYIELLKDLNDIDGVNKYNEYGCDSAIELYYSAWSNNIDNQIRKKITKWFDYFKNSKDHSILISDFSSKDLKKYLFKISPIAYCILYRAYDIIRVKLVR